MKLHFGILSIAPAKYLPALVLPALLTASTAAHAALYVDHGILSQKTTTATGFNYTLDLSGVLVDGGTTRATSVHLACSVKPATKGWLCNGVLAVQGASASVQLRFDTATTTVRWSIAADVSVILQNAHEAWTTDTASSAGGDPPGWAHIDFLVGGQIRQWYYTTSWADTYTSITGLPYGTDMY